MEGMTGYTDEPAKRSDFDRRIDQRVDKIFASAKGLHERVAMLAEQIGPILRPDFPRGEVPGSSPEVASPTSPLSERLGDIERVLIELHERLGALSDRVDL